MSPTMEVKTAPGYETRIGAEGPPPARTAAPDGIVAPAGSEEPFFQAFSEALEMSAARPHAAGGAVGDQAGDPSKRRASERAEQRDEQRADPRSAGPGSERPDAAMGRASDRGRTDRAARRAPSAHEDRGTVPERRQAATLRSSKGRAVPEARSRDGADPEELAGPSAGAAGGAVEEAPSTGTEGQATRATDSALPRETTVEASISEPAGAADSDGVGLLAEDPEMDFLSVNSPSLAPLTLFAAGTDGLELILDPIEEIGGDGLQVGPDEMGLWERRSPPEAEAARFEPASDEAAFASAEAERVEGDGLLDGEIDGAGGDLPAASTDGEGAEEASRTPAGGSDRERESPESARTAGWQDPSMDPAPAESRVEAAAAVETATARRGGEEIGKFRDAEATPSPGTAGAQRASESAPTADRAAPAYIRSLDLTEARDRWLSKLSMAIRGGIHAGESRLRMVLQPPKLGQIEVELHVRGPVLRVAIDVESNAVRHMLNAGAAELRESLRQNGIEVEKIRIAVADPDGRATAHQGRRDGTGGGGEPRGGSGPPAAPDPAEEAGDRLPPLELAAARRSGYGIDYQA